MVSYMVSIASAGNQKNIQTEVILSPTLLDGNDLFVEFKGALTEQYVCQQLKTIEDLDIYNYTNDRGSFEIDFVVDTGEVIVPVEVKAEVNLRAKSLKTYQEKFSPEVSVRTSMADYKKEEWLVNLPLYAIDQITQQASDGTFPPLQRRKTCDSDRTFL